MWSPTLNKNPAFPFKRISLGPVGQSEEIINFFKTWDSNKTFGNPSYIEDKIKTSEDLIKLKGLFWKSNNFTCLEIEAAVFYALNNNRKDPTHVDKMKAGLAFGLPDAVKYNDNLFSCNIYIEGYDYLGDPDGTPLKFD